MLKTNIKTTTTEIMDGGTARVESAGTRTASTPHPRELKNSFKPVRFFSLLPGRAEGRIVKL